MSELKPCPWCGEKMTTVKNCTTLNPNQGMYYIRCSVCHACGPKQYYLVDNERPTALLENSKYRWETRPTEDKLRQERDKAHMKILAMERRSGIAGQAFTDYTCFRCEKTESHGSTATPIFCPGCENEIRMMTKQTLAKLETKDD